METRRLGKTDLVVSRLGMGGLFVSKHGGEFEQARAALHRALDLGVSYVDTAPGYADSEEVIGKALGGSGRPFVLSTKLGGRPQPFEPRNKEHLRKSLEESLRLLKRDYVDILMIHEPDRPGQYDWFESWNPVSGPVTEFLAEAKQKGLIRYTGLGGTTAYELAYIIEHGNFDVVLTAFNYSLLWREAAIAVIPAAKKKGMGIISGSPLQQGWLSRRYDETVRDNPPPWLSPPRREQLLRLYAFVDELGMPLAELALRFVISNENFDTVLMGARSAQEVEMNVRAVEKGPLPADVMRELDKIGAMVPFRPFEEPFGAAIAWGGRRGPGPAR
jgi:aryl-alcohol dehydrogenase-like predicted oxidoreductase